ncbi:hypothetical protein M9Y10_022306 [Tritrichomonas musculus]|uniref:G domain-containing protein n=1 Tax=Tritrichomonas musculus TaxID=1915356 RepID=A0ABR2KSG7_9EUKA
MNIIENNIVNDVTKNVNDNLNAIESSEGNDLAIFFGETTSGKSSTINCLMGVRFVEDEDTDNIMPAEGERIIAPIGNFNEGNVGCTFLPKVYHLPENPIAFLDTQGFSDTRDDHEMNISSSLLIEIAIKRARSVRIIFLTHFEIFKSGIGQFHKIGKLLSKLIINDEEPIYFLFNKFKPSRSLQKQNFYSWPEPNKCEAIKREILDAYNRNVIGLESIIYRGKTQVVEKFLRDQGRPTVVSRQEIDRIYRSEPSLNNYQEYHENNQKILYLSILKNSFSRNYYGYIDPVSDDSRNNLIHDILVLPAINSSNIRLNGYNNERIQFDQMFDKKIFLENKFLKQVLFSLKYPERLIDALINPLQANLTEYRNRLNQINRNGVSDEILNEFNIENVQERHSLETSIENLKVQLENLKIAKRSFENKNPVPFWNDHWENKPGLLWWRNYLCKYPLDIPYVKVVEDLDEHTSRREVISETSPKYEVLYSSGGKVRKGVGIAASVLAGAIGATVMGICSHKCKGKVTLYTYPKILQPDAIPQLKQEIDIIENNLRRLTSDLNMLNNNAHTNIVGRFRNYIQNLENKIQSLESIKTHVHDTVLTWNRDTPDQGYQTTKRNEIFCINSSIRVLYGGSVPRFAHTEFQQSYQAVLNAIPLNSQNINAEILISNGNQVFNEN